jgi:hypothetical protein
MVAGGVHDLGAVQESTRNHPEDNTDTDDRQ